MHNEGGSPIKPSETEVLAFMIMHVQMVEKTTKKLKK